MKAVDKYFPQQGEQGVSTYIENGSTENQVKDVDNHFAQEASRESVNTWKIVLPINDEGDGNEGSMGGAFHT